MAKGMTRKEAEELAADLNKREPSWFCPLINGKCRADCVNFIPSFVDSKIDFKERTGMLHDVKDEDFGVEGFVCSNSMFLGNPMPCGGN